MIRFRLRCGPEGCEVYDGDTGTSKDAVAVFGPAPYGTAYKWAAARNRVSEEQPAAPCCARYERLARAVDQARHELAQISRTTRDAETADAALAAIERLRDMARGEEK